MGNMYRKYLNLEEGYLYIPNNQPPEKCFPDKDLLTRMSSTIAQLH